jgi:hypothetical protein
MIRGNLNFSSPAETSDVFELFSRGNAQEEAVFYGRDDALMLVDTAVGRNIHGKCRTVEVMPSIKLLNSCLKKLIMKSKSIKDSKYILKLIQILAMDKPKTSISFAVNNSSQNPLNDMNVKRFLLICIECAHIFGVQFTRAVASALCTRQVDLTPNSLSKCSNLPQLLPHWISESKRRYFRGTNVPLLKLLVRLIYSMKSASNPALLLILTNTIEASASTESIECIVMWPEIWDLIGRKPSVALKKMVLISNGFINRTISIACHSVFQGLSALDYAIKVCPATLSSIGAKLLLSCLSVADSDCKIGNK